MSKYIVDYYETYSKSYEVEASSQKEAEEIAQEMAAEASATTIVEAKRMIFLKDVDKHHIIVQIHGSKQMK